jgi:hypothetical protein
MYGEEGVYCQSAPRPPLDTHAQAQLERVRLPPRAGLAGVGALGRGLQSARGTRHPRPRPKPAPAPARLPPQAVLRVAYVLVSWCDLVQCQGIQVPMVLCE